MYCSSTGLNTHLTRAAWLWNLHFPPPPRAVINTGKKLWTICSCRWGFVDGVQVAVMESAEMPKICHPNWPVRMVSRTLSYSDTWFHNPTMVSGPFMGSQAHSLSPFSDNTTALTFSRLDSETQGEFHCTAIWNTTKCTLLSFFTIWFLMHKIGCEKVIFWLFFFFTCLKQ